MAWSEKGGRAGSGEFVLNAAVAVQVPRCVELFAEDGSFGGALGASRLAGQESPFSAEARLFYSNVQ